MPEDPRTPGPRTPGPQTPGYENAITPGYGTATTPGYGTVQTPGGTRRRRPARPSMVIMRTGSYGFGSFGRLPSESMRQKVQRTKSHMREQQPLLEPTVDEEDEEAGLPKPSKPSTMDGEQTVAQREAQRDVEVAQTDKDEDDDDGAEEETKSTAYLFLLTLGIGGLQIAWATELASVSPFLLSLGISKALLALVWIAGPLSGTLVQPYIGIRSDNCRLRWGRRRPFIVGGASATIVALLMLSWSREIVAGVGKIFGADPASEGSALATQIFAVAFVYILDFAINVIQAAVRAFIVDCAPTHQQADANAWASRMTGVGNIVGYLSGYLNLPILLPWLGDTQFKILSAIASVVMALTVAISCFSVAEADPRQLPPPIAQGGGVLSFFSGLYLSITRLPPQIRRVCVVQLFAWVAWFPFLFYTTTYIAGIYAEPFFRENSNRSDEDINQIMETGTRLGTFALLIFAVTTFFSSVFLPFFIAPSYRPAEDSQPPTPMSTIDHEESAGKNGDYFNFKNNTTEASKSGFSRFFSAIATGSLHIPYLTLRRAWVISHLIFSLLMFLTFAVRDSTTAIILIGLIGIPWAVTNWAPFALISAEMSKRDAIRRGKRAPPPTRDGELLAQHQDEAEDEAGVILGIHNVAIAAPQVVATLLSSVIFNFLQKPRGAPGDNSVAWVLRFGGLCALGAAWATTKVYEGDADEQDD